MSDMYDSRDDRDDRGDDRSGRGSFIKKRFVFKKKFCRFCKDKKDVIDYKDVDTLFRYTKNKGKILPRRFTGNCPRHQRLVAQAIKRARAIALMPLVSE